MDIHIITSFRFRLLVFILLISASIIYPLTFLLLGINISNPIIKAIVRGIIAGTLAMIPVCICVLIQKSWKLSDKLKSILFIIICFELSAQGELLLINYLFFMSMLVIFVLPIIVVILIHTYIFTIYEKYNTIAVYIDDNLYKLLKSSCIFLNLSLVFNSIVSLGTFSLIFTIIISILTALTVQVNIFKYKYWNISVKFINIVFIEIIFLTINIILNKFKVLIMSLPIIIMIGIFILKEIFLYSNLKASTKYAEEQGEGA